MRKSGLRVKAFHVIVCDKRIYSFRIYEVYSMEWYEFGQRVRRRREELKISQQDIASALKIDQAKVSLIEKGARKVDLIKELPALATVLRCSINTLVQDEDSVVPDEKNPLRILMQQYFPGVQFEEFEMRRIEQFLEPVIQSYIKHSPEFEKKVVNK